jgi:hypothetical protein
MAVRKIRMFIVRILANILIPFIGKIKVVTIKSGSICSIYCALNGNIFETSTASLNVICCKPTSFPFYGLTLWAWSHLTGDEIIPFKSTKIKHRRMDRSLQSTNILITLNCDIYRKYIHNFLCVGPILKTDIQP